MSDRSQLAKRQSDFFRMNPRMSLTTMAIYSGTFLNAVKMQREERSHLARKSDCCNRSKLGSRFFVISEVGFKESRIFANVLTIHSPTDLNIHFSLHIGTPVFWLDLSINTIQTMNTSQSSL